MWRLQEVRRGAESLATLSRLVAADVGLTLRPDTAALGAGAATPGLSFLRFAAPEPSRRIGLAHRIAAHGQRWIDMLAEAAKKAGEDLTRKARAEIG